MDLKLQELRRYAIDNRIEIKFADEGSGRECLINDKGQVKILSEDKNLRIEDVLSAAQSFDIINHGKSQRISRDALAKTINEAFKQRGFAAAAHEED
ncbi:MAG TPA: hypothetical protein VNN73_01965 [Blastocatellia bacterium]|nr:hypothetical protein [Blastocatellia bacterium]